MPRKFGKPYYMGQGVYNVRYTTTAGNEHNIRVKARSLSDARKKAYSSSRSKYHRSRR